MLLKILWKLQEITCVEVSFLIKLQASACNLIEKETLAHVFSCKFCGIFKNRFFIEYLRATTLLTIWRNSNRNLFLGAIFPYRIRRATSDGEGGGFPCPLLKIEKKCLELAKKCSDFGKMCPVCVHLLVKFLI